MILISLTLYFITINGTWGAPLPTINPGSPDKKNIVVGAAEKGSSTKQESQADPMKNLSTEKINLIMYAGRVISTLNMDPKFEEMKKRLNSSSGQDQSLLNLMSMMSKETCEKLSQIKKETVQILKQQNPHLRADYIDFDSEKFSVIDLHLVTEKITIMRPLFEKFMQGKS